MENVLHFIRKATDKADLERKIASKEYCVSYYKIEKTIELSKAEWDSLMADLFEYRDYIKDNKNNMWLENNTFHCLLITTKGESQGLLVESEGYDYPRYTSLINMEEL